MSLVSLLRSTCLTLSLLATVSLAAPPPAPVPTPGSAAARPATPPPPPGRSPNGAPLELPAPQAAVLPAGAPWQLPGEVLVVALRTAPTGVTSVVKFGAVLRGPKDGYLVYRFGTAKAVEQQFPAKLDASAWGQFRWSTFQRAGGGANAGLDLNELQFSAGGVSTTVFDVTSAEDGGARKVGVRVVQGGAPVVQVAEAIEGHLGRLRDATQLPKGRELGEAPAAPAAGAKVTSPDALLGAWAGQASSEAGLDWMSPAYRFSFGKGKGTATVAAGFTSSFVWKFRGEELVVKEVERTEDTPEGPRRTVNKDPDQFLLVTSPRPGVLCFAPKGPGLVPAGCAKK